MLYLSMGIETGPRCCKLCGKLTTKQASKRLYRSICGACSVAKRRKKLKLLGLDYLGNVCEKCGYNKCPAALVFHHRDPREKEFGIGSHGFTRSWERVKKELDKCSLLCANCHAEFHWRVS